jgi:hypothetical protein
MESSANIGNNGSCLNQYHAQDTIFVDGASRQRSEARPVEQPRMSPERLVSDSSVSHEAGARDVEKTQDVVSGHDSDDSAVGRIIRNFTPSYAFIRPVFGLVVG